MRRQLGNYRLLANLGQGGMADVYLARNDGPLGTGGAGHKLAVVKKLRAHLEEDEDFVKMLTDEALITARLEHPNVVSFYELGTAENDELFLAMEFLEGQSLGRVERRSKKDATAMPLDVALLVLVDVLAGLHHAHELVDFDGQSLHVVHRDVNPANVFVTYDGQVKVLDFGVAKARGRLSQTGIGTLKGKLRYMAPEQVAGRPLDRRADIFAVGIMLWQTLAGCRFWGDLECHEILAALSRATYDASPRAVRPEISSELDAICKKALARDPQDRYATAEEMRHALEAHIGSDRSRLRERLGAYVTQLFMAEHVAMRTFLKQEGEAETTKPRLENFEARVSRSIKASLTDSLFQIPRGELGDLPLMVDPPAPSSIAPVSQSRSDLADLLEPSRPAPSAATGWIFASVALIAFVIGAILKLPIEDLAAGAPKVHERERTLVLPDVVTVESTVRGRR